MNESAHVFNHPRAATSSTESLHGTLDRPASLLEGTKRRHHTQQPRQLLSCTKCRERKVKCDRTKPCSACCARGAPKECHFVAEGGDYAPIQQSYELRKLRAENLRLKERLRASKIPIEDNDTDDTVSPDSQLGERASGPSQRRRATKQRRFQGSEWSDSIYFGSPGLASVVTDFANIHLAPGSSQSLAHLMPRGPEMYTSRCPPPHPFATLFKATPDECILQLLNCLPAADELLEYLNFFERRVHLCAFPHVPMEITRGEVERFLDDPRKNAQMCPDMLALLFAALALGSQYSAWDRSGGQWKADAMEEESQRGNVYIAAAMQALRMASFMHKPTLLGIQALIMIGPFLTNSGRFLDAWTLFGTTIRLAHSIGLHRHPKYLDPAPPTQRECSIRQTLWWWMLHMDQEYSMTLGRPLGISGIGDCPPPHELTTNPQMLRFGDFVNHFTVLARQILSSDRLTNSKIDEFTDSLRNLLDTMPEMLQFDDSWLNEKTEIPEWPLGTMAAGVYFLRSGQQHLRRALTSPVFYCKTHTYLILLNRQRIEKPTGSLFSHSDPHNPRATPPSFLAINVPASNYSSPPDSPRATLRGRALVLSSSHDLLTAFIFFHLRVPAAQITWTMGQQAFNSCMILLLDAMETGDLSRLINVERAYVVFLDLEKNGVHQLASMAVDRVSWGLARLGRIQSEPGARVNAHLTSSPANRDSECDIGMPGTAKFEARQSPGAVHDTVMGNTGMILLEDPGLQSFVPETFAPLSWNMGRGFLEGGDSSQTRVKREGSQKEGEEDVQLEDSRPTSHNENIRHIQSSEQGRDESTSPGLTTVQFATVTSAPLQTIQPHGLAAPISPPVPVTILQKRNYSLGGTLTALHQLPPPHLRHHSYGSLHQPPPPSLTAQSQATPIRRDSTDANAMRIEQGARTQSSKSEGNWKEGMYAFRPHPSVSQFAAPQPALHTLPEHATSSAPAQFMPLSDTQIHPSWKPRPPAPYSSISEPTSNISQKPNESQAIPASAQQQSDPMSTWHRTFPHHLSSTSNESVPAPAGMQAEQLAMNQWSQVRGSASE